MLVDATIDVWFVQVRRLNLYKDGDTTHYNQTLADVTLDRCWTQLIKQADYEHRKFDVDKFNRCY